MPKPKIIYTLDDKSLEKDFGIKSAKGLTFAEFLVRETGNENNTFTEENLNKIIAEKMKDVFDE